MRYENRFGSLEVEPVTPVQPVSEIHGDQVDDQHKFNLHTAEQIVLITDNRNSQVAGPWLELRDPDEQVLYLVVHDTPSTAQVVRVVSLNYIGPDPQETLAMPQPMLF